MKSKPPILLLGGGMAIGVAALSQMVPNLVHFGAERLVRWTLCPPRTEDPRQWQWFPGRREAFELTTGDGTTLRGYFLPAQTSRPAGTVVILHGHMSCADQMAWFARKVAGHGLNAVVYDSRAHGKSAGTVCGFGLNEAEDAKQIARHFAGKSGGPVSLWGISMGAAVGAQALAGDTPFDKGVLFAPFSDLDSMIDATLRANGMAWIPGLSKAVRAEIQNVLGVPASAISPLKAAARIQTPVMVVHGAMDGQIPVEHGRMVFSAIPAPEKQFLELAKAGHNDLVDSKTQWGPQTLQRTLDFLGKGGD